MSATISCCPHSLLFLLSHNHLLLSLVPVQHSLPWQDNLVLSWHDILFSLLHNNTKTMTWSHDNHNDHNIAKLEHGKVGHHEGSDVPGYMMSTMISCCPFVAQPSLVISCRRTTFSSCRKMIWSCSCMTFSSLFLEYDLKTQDDLVPHRGMTFSSLLMTIISCRCMIITMITILPNSRTWQSWSRRTTFSSRRKTISSLFSSSHNNTR